MDESAVKDFQQLIIILLFPDAVGESLRLQSGLDRPVSLCLWVLSKKKGERKTTRERRNVAGGHEITGTKSQARKTNAE